MGPRPPHEGRAQRQDLRGDAGHEAGEVGAVSSGGGEGVGLNSLIYVRWIANRVTLDAVTRIVN